MSSNGDGVIRRDQTSDLYLLADSAPSLIHTGNPDGYLDFFNQTWLKYVGQALEDLQGWKWTAFIHPEDVETIVERWRASLASGEPFLHEARVLRADGEYRWMLYHKVAVRDECGQIVKWHGSSIDIEDRKRAEEQLRRNTRELRRSEFYLAEAQRLAHMGSWAFDPAGFDYWSPELFRMHGLDPATKPPSVQEYLNCLDPQERASMANLIEGLWEKALPFDVTKRIVRPNGEVRYIRWVGAPVAENESLKHYVGSALDITEQELASQELQRRGAYLAEAQRLSHTGSFGWKPFEEEHIWSDETYRIFECDRSVKPTLEMVLQRVHPDDLVLAQRIVANASSGTDFEETFRLLMPTGAIKHIHVRAHSQRENSGQIEFVGAVTDVTELKTTDDKIRRLVDASILGIFIANLEGEIVEANQAFLKMLQYDRDDVIAGRLRWADLTPAELRERDQQAVTEALSNGFFQTYEKEFFRKDGNRVPVLLGGALFPGENEGVAFALDLSEQKRAEEALRTSEAYLAEAQRLSKTGSWAWNPASDNTYYSEECYRLLGFEPLGPPPVLEAVIQRIHPDDQAFCREQVEKGVNDKVDFELDYRIVHPDERVRDIHCVCHPVLDGSGDLVELIGTVIDITERKAAEEKIREQEMELRQMLDLLPHQVSVFGPDGERLYANRVSLEYIGFSLEEWRQTPGGFFRPGSFIHPDDRERAIRAYADSGGAAYSFELRVRGADGKYRWFLLHCSPVHDDKGQVKRWLLASANIDERKRAEENLRQENVALREEIDNTSMFEEIVGTSAPLKKVISDVSKVAPTDSGVLITGETGTGKELVARAVHRLSHRSNHPFVTVNCAAIPRDLIASELFGHEKGAFTGATQRRPGRFELATGGTIFLDEVGELPIETQIALLRVLQEHEFERVGGTGPIATDVRVIAATNRDLEAAIATGTFRSDLFYRLNIFPIEMPPLRERREDIPLLVEYFIDRYGRKAGKIFKAVDRKSLELLQSYPWPGNIRELQNVIERSVIVSEVETFSVDESWLSRQPRAVPRHSYPELSKRPASTEKKLIEAALSECRGRVSGLSGAAARLGIPGSTLESKIKSLKIDKNRFRTTA